jgi:hypothetical protein
LLIEELLERLQAPSTLKKTSNIDLRTNKVAHIASLVRQWRCHHKVEKRASISSTVE